MTKKPIYRLALLALLSGSAVLSWSADTDTLLADYTRQGAGPFSAQQGAALWQKTVTGAAPETQRSCTLCHGQNLTATGQHVTTKKVIQPMAPSANRTRLTDAKKVAQWLTRNCKWTFGRDCTPQEKGDVIVYLSNQ